MSLNDPTLWDRLVQGGLAVLTWLTGETGRAVSAGAFGGLYRWFMAERRKLRDGVISVISGAIAASYLGPIVLALLASAGLKLDTGPDLYMTSGFLAGLVGMSVARMVVSLVEAQAKRIGGGK
ncbi:hypothetical protein [Pseudaestuariivita rosea]|uniref:hypothetical protein n=1 Tax=Pseudaestuariivita rosea TaxID=2763263 RepID=UPI001ABBD58C|nr:hypothetical protein [Pseudaestuariivita rosea]